MYCRCVYFGVIIDTVIGIHFLHTISLCILELSLYLLQAWNKLIVFAISSSCSQSSIIFAWSPAASNTRVIASVHGRRRNKKPKHAEFSWTKPDSRTSQCFQCSDRQFAKQKYISTSDLKCRTHWPRFPKVSQDFGDQVRWESKINLQVVYWYTVLWQNYRIDMWHIWHIYDLLSLFTKKKQRYIHPIESTRISIHGTCSRRPQHRPLRRRWPLSQKLVFGRPRTPYLPYITIITIVLVYVFHCFPRITYIINIKYDRTYRIIW